MNCPVCNTGIQLGWKNTNLKQCTCNVIISLTQAGDWKIAMNAVVKNQDPAYIIVGTEGIWEKQKFTVSGRVCAQNEVSVFNYWSIVFEDGTHAFLGEGYGHYTIMNKTIAPFAISFERFEKLRAGETFTSSKKKYRLVRKEKYDQLNVEGENEWPDTGTEFEIFDFFRNEGEFFQIARFKKGIVLHFDCKFYTAAELKLSKTNAVHVTKQHSCGNCNTVNTIHAYPYTYTLSCKTCGKRYLYDRKKNEFDRVKENDKGFVPDIEIGSNGVMDGIEFKVIGYARKQEANADAAQWNEYTLYNPMHGFAYLSEFQGHWVYVKEWPRPPLVTSQGKDYFVENNNNFELFNDYSYRVIGAAGEHIYDLNAASDFQVKEFIYPPQILTREINASEENWFFGDHLEGKSVSRNFAMPMGLPQKIGVGAVQPVGFIKISTLFKIVILGVIAAVITHMGMSGIQQEKTIFSQQLSFEQSAGTIAGVSPVFELNKKESNLEVAFLGDIDNSWMEVEGTFVNTKTGKEYSFNKGIEFYRGYSDGENWQEGNKRGKAVLTEIPAGTYYMEYKATRDSSVTFYSTGGPALDLTVKYDVPLMRNVLWALGFILIAAAAQFAFYYYYDKKRWENSKYTPYNYAS